MCRLDIFRRQNYEALRELEGLAKLTRSELKKRLMQFRSVSEVAEGFGHRDDRSFAELKVEFLREFVQRLTVRLAHCASHLRRDIVRLFSGFFFCDYRHNRAAYFLKTLSVGRFAIQHLDDVEPVLRLYQIRNRTFGGAESSLLEFGYRLLFDYPAEIASLGFGSVIFRILFCEVFEVRSALGFFQDFFGFLTDFGNFSVSLSDRFEKYVLDVGAVFHFVLVDVRVVVGAQDIVVYRGALAQFRQIQQCVTRRPFLSDLITRRVLGVEGGEFGIRGVNRRSQFRGLYERVFNLHLFISPSEFVLNFSRCHADGIRDQLAEFLLQHIVAQKTFEFRDGHPCAGLVFRNVTVLGPGSTFPCRRQQLLDALRFFLRRHANSKPRRFHFEGEGKNNLIQNLLGVKTF